MTNSIGSVHNFMTTNSNIIEPQPIVGMGVTQICYSDRRAFTVIATLGHKEILIQKDRAIRTDKNGPSDWQNYTFEPNPDGEVVTLVFKTSKKKPNGRWVAKGDSINGVRFILGIRKEHFDYSF
jgi:hypothetical protein